MKIYKFYTEHCPQCKYQSELLKELKDIDIIPVDCENDPEDLVSKYQVRTLPTLVFIDKDEEFSNKVTGITTIDEINNIIEKYDR